jgi:peptidoglycan-associated lipoprotein
MRSSKFFAVLLASVMVLSACSSVQLDKKAPVDDRTGSSASTSSSNDSAKTGAANDGSADSRAGDKNAQNNQSAQNNQNAQNTDPLNDATGMLAKRSVYFDFDSYVVKDEFKPVIEAHSQYLIKNTDRKIVIQGNTDERGGSEYNLALGQKRAEAVRRALNLLGVADSQIEAVSFGKEKPKATGSNEAAWAENRRADIVY